jgi:hypothetical protein
MVRWESHRQGKHEPVETLTPSPSENVNPMYRRLSVRISPAITQLAKTLLRGKIKPAIRTSTGNTIRKGGNGTTMLADSRQPTTQKYFVPSGLLMNLTLALLSLLVVAFLFLFSALML